MTRTRVLLVLAALALPLAQADAAVVYDPARDVMVTENGALVPVDSIDLVGYSIERDERGTHGATLRMADLTRRGLEDRLFVHSSHAVRLYGATVVFDDARALQLLAVQMDGHALSALALLADADEGVVQLDASATLDEAQGTVSWALASPVAGREHTAFAFTFLQGCDDLDACEPPMRGVAPLDMAPNDLADPLVTVIPGMWWADLLAEDDGTIPPPPVSLASLVAA